MHLADRSRCVVALDPALCAEVVCGDTPHEAIAVPPHDSLRQIPTECLNRRRLSGACCGWFCGQPTAEAVFGSGHNWAGLTRGRDEGEIDLIEGCGHQELAEGGHAREALPFREAQDNWFGLTVAGDDGGFAAYCIVHHGGQAGLGVAKLDFPHGGLRTRRDYSGHI